MSEKNTEADSPAADETVGGWLRAAREAAGLGPDAVAEALHLDRATIEAIEANNFERLGASVFAKGHIKAYAAHLSLDNGDALERYYRTAGQSANTLPPLTVSKSVSRGARVTPQQALLGAAALLAVILIVLAVRLLTGDEPAEPAAPSVPPAAQPDTTRDASPPASDTAARAGATATPDRTPSPGSFADRLASAGAPAGAAAAQSTTGSPRVSTTSTPAAADSASAPAVAAPVPDTGMQLRFSDECWYEVRDAAGRRLATGTGRAGQSRTVRGARPLSVTLGFADGVDVFVDGEQFDIPASARRGRRAIFSVP